MTRPLLTLTLGGVLIVSGYFAVRPLVADVRVVRIEGDLTRAEKQQVMDTVSAALGASDWTVASDMANAVEALGWVRTVRVRRQWPDALHIAVRRHTVAARWGDDGWLTSGGEVFPAIDNIHNAPASPLPTFETTHADGPTVMRLFSLLSESAEAAGLTIGGLYEDAAGNWTASVANGVPLLLGNQELSARFSRFATVYRKALRDIERAIERVDARYDTGVAVRWLPPGKEAMTGHHARQVATVNFATLSPEHGGTAKE